MEISFVKIKQLPIDINYSSDGASIKGSLERVNRDCVEFKATFEASIPILCNRCGKEYIKDVNYPLELILSEGRYNNNDKIDVIEFFEGKVDFDYILKSEIASIEEEYNFCESCIDNDDILEIEF